MRFDILFVVLISSCSFTASTCPDDTSDQPDTDTSTGLEQYLTSVLNRVFTGACSGVSQVDPLTIPYIQGNFATFQYYDNNTVVTGLSQTNIISLKISEDFNMTQIKLDIPSFTINSLTDFTGYLLYLPSNGAGLLELDYGRYSMKIYAQLILVGDDTCQYLQFGNFSVDAQALGPINFNVRPIYDNDNGNDVTTQRNTFMTENYEDMAFFIQDPKVEPIVQSILSYANQDLLTVSYNTLTSVFGCPAVAE